MDTDEGREKAIRTRILRSLYAKQKPRDLRGLFVKNKAILDNQNQTHAVDAKDFAQNSNPVSNFQDDRSRPAPRSEDPPLVNIKVTNPVTYFKNWWSRVIGNEGIEMKASLKIRPLTAFLLLAFVISGE